MSSLTMFLRSNSSRGLARSRMAMPAVVDDIDRAAVLDQVLGDVPVAGAMFTQSVRDDDGRPLVAGPGLRHPGLPIDRDVGAPFDVAFAMFHD